MKKIDPLHLQKFYDMLAQLDKIVPLDLDNIRTVIEGKGKSSFPSGDNHMILLAVKVEFRDQCLPMTPIVAVTSPPHQLSEHAGVLEFKIMDSRVEKNKKIYYIAYLSMFPSGRMVFGMDGARLDSNGKNIIVQESAIKRDDQLYGDHILIRKLRKTMVEIFQSKEPAAIAGKEKILRALNDGLSKIN